MCYYSKELRAGTFRDAKENENLYIYENRHGDTVARAEDDGKVVCLMARNDLHTEKLVINQQHLSLFKRTFPSLVKYIGQPVSMRFCSTQVAVTRYSADRVFIDGDRVNFGFLGQGMRFYIGPKRPSLADKLGVNDPSITLDHDPDPKPEDKPVEPIKEPGDQPAPEPAPETTVNPVTA